MPASQMRVALFGTSADPPTIGHQTILGWLSDHYNQVAVWAADNPFKIHGATLAQRSQMLQILIDHLDCPNVQLDARLSDRHSLNTLRKARTLWQGQPQFYLVIGSDLVGQIHRWYRAKDLLTQVTLLIFPRKGYPLQPEALQGIKALSGTWHIADYTPPSVSSSEFRQAGRRKAVTPAIADYIQIHQLYRQHSSP